MIFGTFQKSSLVTVDFSMCFCYRRCKALNCSSDIPSSTTSSGVENATCASYIKFWCVLLLFVSFFSDFFSLLIFVLIFIIFLPFFPIAFPIASRFFRYESESSTSPSLSTSSSSFPTDLTFFLPKELLR